MAIINYLTEMLQLEATYQIQEDVDMIFELIKNSEFYKKVINLEDIPDSKSEVFLINSKDLNFKSDECIESNSKNPFELTLNFEGDTDYTPKGSVKLASYSKIRIGILGGLYSILVKRYNIRKTGDKWCAYNKCYESIPEILNDRMREQYAKYEFKDYRIKGSLHHELIHWIDDSIHDNFISKKLNVANANIKNPKIVKKTFYQKRSRTANSPIEINAQIGAIKEIRNSMSQEEWDELSLKDMLFLNPSFVGIWNNATEEEQIEFKIAILKRLQREGLLGKNMRNVW